MTDLPGVFQSAQLQFDDVIQRLPASAKLLATIKGEYDVVLKKLQSSQDRAAMQEVQTILKTTQVASMNNHYKRIRELEVQLGNVNVANKKIQLKMDDMRLERERLVAEYDERVRAMHREQVEHSKIGAHQPNMSLDDSLSISFLQDHLAKLEVALEEAREITEKKYITDQKRVGLQNRLREKERFRAHVISENKTLSLMCRRLDMAKKAVRGYLSYLQAHQLDQAQFPLEHYIQAVLVNQTEANTVSSSEEEAEDPVKEMEAEMLLDAYEMFNKLFEAERYQEAALHAATSPKGVLRTQETLVLFRDSARHQPGEKLPLLVYTDHLLQCAPAYQPISLQESLECTKCLIQQGEVNRLTHWIAQACIPPSIELGKLISGSCACSSRCSCGFQNLAFRVFDQSRAYPQACLCMLLQGQFVAFLSYASRSRIYRADYEDLLNCVPRTAVALALTCPPPPHQPVFTIFEVMHSMLLKDCSRQRGKMAQACLHAYLKKTKLSFTECIMQDNRTKTGVWQDLPLLLHSSGLGHIALELLSEMVVEHALSKAIKELHSEPAPPLPGSSVREQISITPGTESVVDSSSDTEDYDQDSSDEAESPV